MGFGLPGLVNLPMKTHFHVQKVFSRLDTLYH
jgi:hypothetical protein